MDDYSLPRGYVGRKLALSTRLDALGDGEDADCARALWGLLLEIEKVAGEHAQAAKDARDTLENAADAIAALQKAGHRRR